MPRESWSPASVIPCFYCLGSHPNWTCPQEVRNGLRSCNRCGNSHSTASCPHETQEEILRRILAPGAKYLTFGIQKEKPDLDVECQLGCHLNCPVCRQITKLADPMHFCYQDDDQIERGESGA